MFKDSTVLAKRDNIYALKIVTDTFLLIRAGIHNTCANPYVKFKVFDIMPREIFTMLGIKFITKTELFYKALIL